MLNPIPKPTGTVTILVLISLISRTPTPPWRLIDTGNNPPPNTRIAKLPMYWVWDFRPTVPPWSGLTIPTPPPMVTGPMPSAVRNATAVFLPDSSLIPLARSTATIRPVPPLGLKYTGMLFICATAGRTMRAIPKRSAAPNIAKRFIEVLLKVRNTGRRPWCCSYLIQTAPTLSPSMSPTPTLTRKSNRGERRKSAPSPRLNSTSSVSPMNHHRFGCT